MKLNCVVSDTTLGGNKAVFGLLREQNREGSRHIFIVPDRYTLGVEREICETLYPDGAFNVDVCSFTRLAQKALGRNDRPCLSKEGTVLLMDRVISENLPELVYYDKAGSLSFSREMFAAIASLRSSGIEADVAEEKGKEIEGVVGEKLKDVAVIYKAYERALKEKYFDTVTRVDWLIDNLPSTFVKDCHVYVIGFNVFSEKQLNFIEKALLYCPSVSVSFCKSLKGSNTRCYPTEQMEKLLLYCKERGIDTDYRQGTEVLSPVFDFLHTEVFGDGRKIFGEKTDDVRINGYLNVYEEIKAISREIVYLVRNKGLRYKEIAVACNNGDYNGIFSKTFKRYDIPYFIDEKYYVKRGFFATFVRSIFDCAESGMEIKATIKVARHPYFNFDRGSLQAFESYAIRYNVNYSSFLKEFSFEDNESAENVRREIADKVSFTEKAAKVSDYCDYVLSLAEDEKVKAKEEEFSSAEDERKIYADKSRFIGVVGEIKSLCGDRKVSRSEFIDMLFSAIDDMTFSLLPRYMDSVFVGNTSESRFSDVRVLFIAGANDGYFPVTGGDKLIFGNYDTEIMKKNGLTIFPSPEETNFFEQFAVIDLLSKPEKLYISYARTSASGDQLSEGNGVREIKRKLCAEEKKFASYYVLSDEERIHYDLATPKNCLFEYSAGYVPAEYRESVRDYLISEGYLGAGEGKEERPDLLRGYYKTADGEYKLSVSRMESYFTCPFANFAKNVLDLSEKEEGGLKPNDNGNLIHEVLEKYFKKGEFLRRATPEEREKFAEKCIAETFSSKELDRFKENFVTKTELNEVRKECYVVLKALTDNMLNSDYTPFLTEKYFGDGKEICFETGNDKFLFTGKVDRVDIFEDKVVIIDYKTGSSDADLEKVYTGKKFQLYLYMKYFKENGYEIAGAFYLPIPNGYKKAGVSYAMKGQMLNDVNTFISMDKRVTETQSGTYKSPNVDFGVKKKGDEIEFSSKKNNLLYKEDFDNVCYYVVKLIKKAVEEIKNGNIERKPTEKACDYCPCKKICGDVNARKKESVKVTSFAEVNE